MRSLLVIAVAVFSLGMAQSVEYKFVWNGKEAVKVAVESEPVVSESLPTILPHEPLPVPPIAAMPTAEPKVTKTVRAIVPVTTMQTVCRNGQCRDELVTSYVETEVDADQPAANKPIVNPNFVPSATAAQAATVWATPTGVPMATNSTCTTCGQNASAAFASNSGPLPFVRATAEHLMARPKLFNGNFRKRLASLFHR